MKTRALLLSLVLQITFFSQAVPFWWEYFKKPAEVGALFECSESVGSELMHFIEIHKEPRHILELGAGRGAITKVITQYLRPKDHLDVVEINPHYCIDLLEKFSSKKFTNMQIHCVDALSFKTDKPYDFIICTIPLTTMDNGLLSLLFNKFKKLSHSGTYFAYVQYGFLFKARKFLAHGVNRELLTQREALIEKFKEKHIVRTKFITQNIPPIYVHHLKFT